MFISVPTNALISGIKLILKLLRHVSLFLHHFQGAYSGTDKSLARPGRKQATATEDFDFHVSYL